VIADNLSAHKTTRVDDFLTEYTNVHLHFTHTDSVWLSQDEVGQSTFTETTRK
jgi:hypothetical protein